MLMVTPPARFALIALPSASERLTVGIVTDGSLPPSPGAEPATLLTITQAIAPAFCAASAFCVKAHVPRSINAILPFIAPPLISAVQPSDVGAAPSSARTTGALTVAAPAGAPKSAVPKDFVPALPAGEGPRRTTP